MKVLILSRAVVGSKMASPGIRSFHMARVLGDALPDAEVTLAVPHEPDFDVEELSFRVVTYDQGSVASLIRGADVVVAGALPPQLLASTLGTTMVLDMYSPYYPEWLAISVIKRDPRLRRAWLETHRQYLIMQLSSADYVLCANERQRDLYVGMLASLGLLTPAVYDEDPMLGHLFGIIPYGVRPGEPTKTADVLKGVHPGIGTDDKVILWNGTLIEWYDVDTLVEAMGRLSNERPDIKLFFLGTHYPTADADDEELAMGTGVVRHASARCEELGILDKTVFFNTGWCPYDETANYLLEADAGICTSFDTIESRYAFRTRYVDLFWAGLPAVCTRGDVLAELIEKEPLGVTVPPEDPDALAAAMKRAVDDQELIADSKRNLEHVREEYRWERVLEPLVRLCAEDPEARRRGHGLRLATTSMSYGSSRLYQYLASRITGEL